MIHMLHVTHLLHEIKKQKKWLYKAANLEELKLSNIIIDDKYIEIHIINNNNNSSWVIRLDMNQGWHKNGVTWLKVNDNQVSVSHH